MSEFFSFYSNLLRNPMMKEKAEKVAVKRNIALSFLSRLGLYLSKYVQLLCKLSLCLFEKGDPLLAVHNLYWTQSEHSFVVFKT
jgi:hypothetical protein